MTGGHLGKRAFGAEVGDAERLLDREARASSLRGTRRGPHRGEAPFAAQRETLEDLALALRIVERLDLGFLLGDGDLARDVRPLFEQIENGVVESVDAGSRAGESRLAGRRGWGCARQEPSNEPEGAATPCVWGGPNGTSRPHRRTTRMRSHA